MTPDRAKPLPEPTLKRLPLYHRFLKELQPSGRQFVSCTEIGANLSLDPTQVRKDLEAAGIQGRPRIGYGLSQVIDGLDNFLGWKKVNEAFLVGAGSMGSALLGYHRFEDYGLRILAAFDSDLAKVGTKIHGKQIFPIQKLGSLARRMQVLIGIITVPAAVAQQVADDLVGGGIRAIWNFAPARLRVPEYVIVHNEDLYCSLASLSLKLANELRKDTLGQPPVTVTVPVPKPPYPMPPASAQRLRLR
jgi:redox-sensing transcriptional repressor